MRHYLWRNRDLILRIKVVPRSSRMAISGLLGDRLKVNLTAAPVEGSANDQLVRWFSKLCGVPKSRVAIIAGETNQAKEVLISNPEVIPAEFQLDLE